MPPAKREAVRHMKASVGLSVVGGCRCVGLSPAAYYREPVDWQVRDAEVIDVLNELVAEFPRARFWKLMDVLTLRGYASNHKRVYRVYCALGLNEARRTKRRLPARSPQPLVVPQQADQVWSADFMSDALYGGLRFRTFNVIDDYNREALTIEVDTSLRGELLVRIFERLAETRGLPDMLRVDNGPEFQSNVFTGWCERHGVLIDYIEPGSPIRTRMSNGSTGPTGKRF